MHWHSFTHHHTKGSGSRSLRLTKQNALFYSIMPVVFRKSQKMLQFTSTWMKRKPISKSSSKFSTI